MTEFQLKDINGFTYNQGKIYMISPYISAIMEYDFSLKKVSKICSYPKDVCEESAFERMITYDSRIYLFPCCTDSIYCYNTQTHEYTKLLELSKVARNIPKRKYIEVLEYKDFIYAVCCYPNMIIRINPVDNDIQIWKLNNEISKSESIINHQISACIYNDKLIYLYSSNIEIQFCISEKSFQVKHLEKRRDNWKEEKYGYILGMAINKEGKQWAYNWNGDVYEIRNDKMLKIDLPSELEGVYDDDLYDEQAKISRILFKNDKLYIVLHCDYRILVYDINASNYYWIRNTYITAWKSESRKIAYDVYAQMDMSTFLFYNCNDGKIYVFDVDKGFINKIKLNIPTDDILDDECFHKYMESVFMRTDNLNIYMQYINKNCISKSIENECHSGREIFREMASG